MSYPLVYFNYFLLGIKTCEGKLLKANEREKVPYWNFKALYLEFGFGIYDCFKQN